MRVASLIVLVLLVAPVGLLLAGVGKATDKASHGLHETAAAAAHEHHEHGGMEEQEQSDRGVGVDERLGEKVPLQVLLRDEQGRQLRLGSALTKPTLLLPVYYSCPATCPMMLADLARAINETPLELGKDYKVLAFSFDDEDGPDLARRAKENYAKLLDKGLPREEWSFLTGSKESIRALTDGIGFRFKKTQEHVFVHPNVLLALAPDGTIIRYLYGPSFLPFDIGMALTEAAKGTPALSVRKLLTYCFAYDSETRSYVFKSFRLLAVGILILLLAFLFFLLRKGKPTA